MHDEVEACDFADLTVGRTAAVETVVTAGHIDAFASLSGDVSPVHMDDEFAKRLGFEGRIAHGMLIAAHVSRLIGTVMPGATGVLQTAAMEFRLPCYAGTRIRVEGEVVKRVESVRIVRIGIRVTNAATGDVLATGTVQSGIPGAAAAAAASNGGVV